MIKPILCALGIALLASLANSQNSPSNCDIQALAIEAALGNRTAQYNLAVEFHRGEKVAQDLAKAATLWRLSAKAGDIDSHNNLGHLTYYGRGIKQNFAEGIRLWRIAATNGHSESMVHMAHAHADGKFLKIDYVEAFAWATSGKTAALADDDPEMQKAISEMADEVLAEVEPNLKPSQLALAKRRANLYVSRYVK